ncbi:hypothetical protein BDFG_00562 [Blastomyces dermatitidis ATCC 26199]|nr:hypothetical protein BDFG_00562 [Blastomyces dermatitidis ATCC 26199]
MAPLRIIIIPGPGGSDGVSNNRGLSNLGLPSFSSFSCQKIFTIQFVLLLIIIGVLIAIYGYVWLEESKSLGLEVPPLQLLGQTAHVLRVDLGQPSRLFDICHID